MRDLRNSAEYIVLIQYNIQVDPSVLTALAVIMYVNSLSSPGSSCSYNSWRIHTPSSVL